MVLVAAHRTLERVFITAWVDVAMCEGWAEYYPSIYMTPTARGVTRCSVHASRSLLLIRCTTNEKQQVPLANGKAASLRHVTRCRRTLA